MSDPRLCEWIAFRRIHDGGVAKSAGMYFDHGRPVPDHLVEVFDRLTWTELVSVAEGDPIWGLRRLSLTDAGQARYAVLCQQRAQREPPAGEFGIQTTVTPVGHRSNATPLAPPGDQLDPGGWRV